MLLKYISGAKEVDLHPILKLENNRRGLICYLDFEEIDARIM